ncbi:hypothetical protein EDB86DRAFT_2829610 [Lactarius hatsudake]|nr:hypothetical protein EDB86DRAFT_2829610 [Lactarius hatsudake]
MLRWRGGSAGSCATWRSLGVCWVGVAGGVGVGGGWQGVARRVRVAWGLVAGGGVLRAVSGWRGGWWRLGLACHVEAAWRVGGVLRVMLRQHGGLAVAGCCVPYWGGVVVGWWSGCCVPCWGGGGVVSRVMSGRRAGGRLEMTRMLEAAAISCNVQAVVLRAVLGRRWGGVASHVGAACWGGAVVDDSRARGGGNSLQRSGRGIASHVGAACWGGDKWRWLRWLACTRGRQWPAALKPWGWSAWNNGVVAWADGKESVSHLTPACAPTSTPRPASPDSPFQAPLPSSLVVKTRQMMHWDEAPPLPPPRARKLPPFVPAPTRRPDMARNTPPPPTRRHCQPAAPP